MAGVLSLPEIGKVSPNETKERDSSTIPTNQQSYLAGSTVQQQRPLMRATKVEEGGGGDGRDDSVVEWRDG